MKKKITRSYRWLAIVCICAVLGALAIGTSAKASFGGFSWERVEQMVASLMWGEIKTEMSAPDEVSEEVGVHSSNVKQVAESDITTNTTTPANLCNNSGVTRYVDKVTMYLEDSSGSLHQTYGTVIYSISTSTSRYASSTYEGIYPLTAFTTSSAPQVVATSTFTVVANRSWGDGVCIVPKFPVVASTTGFIAVDYWLDI